MIEVGDVVQIDPAHDPTFAGCFMQVTEVKSWGLLGFFEVPGKDGQAYYRVPHGKYQRIGKAAWKLDD